jgi:hypothetical protein
VAVCPLPKPPVQSSPGAQHRRLDCTGLSIAKRVEKRARILAPRSQNAAKRNAAGDRFLSLLPDFCLLTTGHWVRGSGVGRSGLDAPAAGPSSFRLSFERLLQIVEPLLLLVIHAIDAEPDRLSIKRRCVDAEKPVDEPF